MKKKLLLFTIIPLQFIFFLWITGCNNKPPAMPQVSTSTVHTMDIVNGCDTNCCFGPPFYTEASEEIGPPNLVQCFFTINQLQTLCPTVAATEETATATITPGTPTPTQSPTTTPSGTQTITPSGTQTATASLTQTFTPTETPTDTFTPLPTDTITPVFTATPNLQNCADCQNTYSDNMQGLAVFDAGESIAILGECSENCLPFLVDPFAYPVCFGVCSGTLYTLAQVQSAATEAALESELDGCLEENNCP